MQLEHRLSALLQLRLHSRLNTCLQNITKRQLQAQTRTILVLWFGASYIKYFTVIYINQTEYIPWDAVIHGVVISSRPLQSLESYKQWKSTQPLQYIHKLSQQSSRVTLSLSSGRKGIGWKICKRFLWINDEKWYVLLFIIFCYVSSVFANTIHIKHKIVSTQKQTLVKYCSVGFVLSCKK